MTDFAIRYSYFNRALGRSGHGEATVRIQSNGDIEAGEGEGEGQGDIDAGEGRSEGEMTLDFE